jgi:hypothetical protein
MILGGLIEYNSKKGDLVERLIREEDFLLSEISIQNTG